MRLICLFIVLTGNACVSWSDQDRGAEAVSEQSSGLGSRGTVVKPDGGIGSGGGGPGGGLEVPDFGGVDLWTEGSLEPGAYWQEVVDVQAAWDGRDDLYEGALSTVTIDDGPTGASLHGFVDLQVVGLDVAGSGLLIEADPGYDCTVEWMQAVEGRVHPDGLVELDIAEVVAIAGKQCALTDLGDPHLEDNRYSVTLIPL